MSGDLKIAMCGLGLMGTPIAERIAAAGYQIAVWGRSAAKSGAVPHRAAYLARSASEAATNADVVVLCLANEQAVEEVVFGAEGVASQRRPRFVLDHSSISPNATRRLSSRLHEATGAIWIDAPVSGGVGGAVAGTLSIMMGSDKRANLTSLIELKSSYAHRITSTGDVGTGQLAKLCNQVIVSANLLAITSVTGTGWDTIFLFWSTACLQGNISPKSSPGRAA